MVSVFGNFISGDHELYMDIIEPLGHQAKEKNDEFVQSYSCKINEFTREFINSFCGNDGKIAWDKLIQFNSGA